MMKKSSVFQLNCTLLVALVTALLISMPVFCYGDLQYKSNSAPIVADEDDTIPVSDLGRQIDILAYKLENLENSLKGVSQSVTKTNEYIKTELVDVENEDPGIIKNVVRMIAYERQEVENALKQQRELKALLKYYGSVLKEKTALLEINADSRTDPAAAGITEIKTDAALSESEPEHQMAETAVLTAVNTLSQKIKKEEFITITHLAIGLILIFVVVLLIVTLTIFRKISRHMDDSGELRVDTTVPLPTARDQKSGTNRNVDYSLPIVVGEAVFRMRMMINGVDRSNEQFAAFGCQLSRLEDAIIRHGYSIVDLTGEPYKNEQSMKVVNIVERDDIAPGATIINTMLKPRIMYDKIIVSHGTVELATSSKAKT
jgi:hypothetical protein